MRDIPFEEMNFFQIKVFLSAAEDLNFTKTAARCYVSQPTVSRIIDTLEKQTGLQLFVRGSTGLRLTPAGKSLYRDLGKAMDDAYQAFNHAWKFQEGHQQHLTVSCPVGVSPDLLFRIAEEFAKTHPAVQFHYQLSHKIQQDLEWLLSDEIDFALTHSHFAGQAASFGEIRYRELVNVPLSVFMTRENPLSARDAVRVEDLRSQKLIFPKERRYDDYEAMIMELFARANIHPLLADKVSSPEEGILNLQENNEVLILDQFALTANRSDCLALPLEDSRSGLILVYRSADEDKTIYRDYIAAATAVGRAFAL